MDTESTTADFEKSTTHVSESDLSTRYSEEGPKRMVERRHNDSNIGPRDIPARVTESVLLYDDGDGSKFTHFDDPISESSDPSENSKNSFRSSQSEHTKKVSMNIDDNDITPRNEKLSLTMNSVLIDTAESQISRSQSDRTAEQCGRSDGFLSDSGLKDVRNTDSGLMHETTGRKRRPSIGKKFSTVLGFNRKSSSTNNLDKKPRSSFQRSEEVIPAHFRGDKKMSMALNKNDDGGINIDSNMANKNGASCERINRKDGTTITESAKISASERNESHVETFVEGLGPGQLVGRQVLGMPCLGEIQLSFMDRKGHMEVEVIRARNLVPKSNGKLLAQPYIKLHLLDGKLSVEKQRTTVSARKTLDPLYQQQILFSSNYKHKILQVSVWGENGRMEKKTFMGMCDILLDDLNLSSIVFGWYKLFGMTASNVQHHQKTSSNSPE